MPTLPSVLASIPGLGGYLAQNEATNQQGMEELQKASGVNSLLTSIRAQQQDRQLREAVAASGGDLTKAMQAAIAGGNLAGAAKLAPLIKLQNDQKLTEQFAGAGSDVGSLTADQLDQLATRAAVANHPGAVGFAKLAEQKRAKENSTNTLGLMRDTPQGVAAGTMVPGTNQQAVTDIPPDERAAFEQVARATAAGQPATVAPQPGDAQMMGGGALTPLMGSSNPAIASRAKMLQAMINNPSFKGDAATVQKEIDNLTAMEARAHESGNRLVTVIGPDGKPMYTPQSQASGAAPAPRPSAAGGGTQTQGVLDPVKDQAELRDLAVQSLYDSNALAGFRRDTKTMASIMRERMKVMNEAGITSEDAVSGRAGFKADTMSLNKLTPQYDAVTAFEKNAIRNGERLVQLGDVVDQTGIPALERWIRAGRKATGDTDVSKLDAQMQIYRTEAARVLTNPNLTGQLTDSARHEVEGFLGGGASAKQIREVVGLLKNDFENRKATLEDQISAIRTRMRSRVSPGGGEAAAPVAASAPSTKPRIKLDAQGNIIQ